MTNKKTDIEKFQYDHIFNLISGIFKFNEKKYGNFVKDTIKILLEFEKNGETIIDVDNSLIIFEILEDGWPNKHLGGYIYLFLKGLPDFELFEKSNCKDISPGIFIGKAPLKRINYLDNLF